MNPFLRPISLRRPLLVAAAFAGVACNLPSQGTRDDIPDVDAPQSRSEPLVKDNPFATDTRDEWVKKVDRQMTELEGDVERLRREVGTEGAQPGINGELTTLESDISMARADLERSGAVRDDEWKRLSKDLDTRVESFEERVAALDRRIDEEPSAAMDDE